MWIGLVEEVLEVAGRAEGSLDALRAADVGVRLMRLTTLMVSRLPGFVVPILTCVVLLFLRASPQPTPFLLMVNYLDDTLSSSTSGTPQCLEAPIVFLSFQSSKITSDEDAIGMHDMPLRRLDEVLHATKFSRYQVG